MSLEAEKTKVLFIGGWGRSGSTILELMLGEMQGYYPVGEIYNIWVRGFDENQLCSCGNPFKECEFWCSVVEEAFGGFQSLDMKEVLDWQQSIDRMRYIPQLAFPSLRRIKYKEKFQQYAGTLERLYTAIKKVSNCKVIVDSSKEPTHGFVLNAIHQIDLGIVHLIRDSRGVAFSWQRKKSRPEIYWKKEYMPKYSFARSAIEWNIRNLIVDMLSLLCKRNIKIFYEDLVAQPRTTVSKLIKDLLGTDANMDFLKGNELILAKHHTVSGNPNRFGTGIVEIKADIEWTRAMKMQHYFIVTILTLPLLWCYGYSLKRRTISYSK